MYLLLFIIACAILIYRFFALVKGILKRIRLMVKTSTRCKEKAYVFSKKRSAFASFVKKSKEPDFTVETPDTLYCVRFITCITKRRYYHFASETHCVRVRKLAFSLRTGLRTPYGAKLVTNSFVISKKLIKYPKMEVPATDKRVEKILLFNPAPILVSTRNEKGAVETAFNFTRMHEYTMLDAVKFAEVVSGETRIEDMQKN